LDDKERNDVKPNSFLKNGIIEHELKNLREPNVISIALNLHFHKSRA